MEYFRGKEDSINDNCNLITQFKESLSVVNFIV